MDQIILFGDNLTEQSFTQHQPTTFAWGAALSALYARRLDIINRGLSGYNSTQALRALPLCLPEPTQTSLRLLTIAFGTNDARIPNSPGGPDQSVSVPEFVRNLRDMGSHPAVRAHADTVKFVFITPPPVDERRLARADAEKYGSLVMGGKLRRRADRTAEYAKAVRELGLELGVPVCDVWSAMVVRAGFGAAGRDEEEVGEDTTSGVAAADAASPGASSSADTGRRDQAGGSAVGAAAAAGVGGGGGSAAGGGGGDEPAIPLPAPLPGSLDLPPNESLQSFLQDDGVHLSAEGSRVLFGELMSVIDKHYPELMPSALRMRLPAWDDVDVWMAVENNGRSEQREQQERMRARRPGGEGGRVVKGEFEAVLSDTEQNA
ncbi:hypothetical protein KC332_g16965 [Hortaea werneckii]|uniref:SGNH hydrolase-type esterase domain-containing protein n=1 Tax=Hortaea werneckii TaxID=91943 RepID=A0A3M7IBK9_HORWE|nr:hypothetical protein KC358_g15262 [Hortaea werneckii]KAI6836256.1 hypothetical protein KC350_g6335 [Hortaea werneckii]KAI6899591.1 hypothetical protein KC348_g17098 [Hortaea werneckii]KAI6919619.1 hypothetical protein KC341_g17160 [Hortaea werneckii]KAI6953443.1 hypothetical protein KC321_g16961 [Hortaea werneckii]